MTPSGGFSAGSPVRPVRIAQSAPLLVIVRVNLLKTSRNLPVISDSWMSVAEKILLGLRIDAIRSHFAPCGVHGGYGAERTCRRQLRAANQHRRCAGIGGASGRQGERRDHRLG